MLHLKQRYCLQGDTPQGGHGSHGPWVSDAMAKYGEQIVPQFGLYNAEASYPMDIFAKWIRINKQAHQSRGLNGMVPWVTTGFDGVLEPPQVLAQAVHMLAGGCTGFNLFCSARPARILFLRASVCAAPTLNAAGQSRVTASLR